MGNRFYTRFNKKYPSVSTVLSTTMPIGQKMAIINWRKKLGNDANQQQREITNRGTNFHKLIECFVKNQSIEVLKILEKPKMQKYLEYALPILKHLQTGKALLTESRVFSDKYGYAGTLDLLMYFSNPARVVLLDWKTSDKPKQEKYCHDHYLQLAAYANAVQETHKIKVSSATLCVFYDFQAPSIFNLSTEQLNNSFNSFLERLTQYQKDKAPLTPEIFNKYYQEYLFYRQMR